MCETHSNARLRLSIHDQHQPIQKKKGANTNLKIKPTAQSVPQGATGAREKAKQTRKEKGGYSLDTAHVDRAREQKEVEPTHERQRAECTRGTATAIRRRRRQRRPAARLCAHALTSPITLPRDTWARRWANERVHVSYPPTSMACYTSAHTLLMELPPLYVVGVAWLCTGACSA